MNTIEINIPASGISEKVQFPSCWEEVQPKHFETLLKLALKPMREWKKIRMVLKGFGVSKRALKKTILMEQREIMKTFTWLNDPWETHQNLIPRIGIFKGYRPAFRLLKMNQLLMAGQYIEQAEKYQKQSEDKKFRAELEKLSSVLYTPFGVPYSYFMSKVYRLFFKVTPLWKLQAVAVSFNSGRMWLKSKFPLTHTPDPKSEPSDHGPYGLIVDLAGPKFGTVHDVNYVDVLMVFVHLEKLAEIAINNKEK